MRGLAMILIAVAVLLAAWALWSMQGKDDTSASSTGQTQSTETNAGTIAPADSSSNADGSADSSDSSDSEQASGEPGTTEQAASSEQPAAGGSANGNSTPVNTLYVLNNSTVPQLAARVADSLSGDYPKVESGNLPDTIIPQNTVYFTAGNTEAEKAARELADRVSGVAMERSDALPTETEGKDAIVLVLVQDVAL